MKPFALVILLAVTTLAQSQSTERPYFADAGSYRSVDFGMLEKRWVSSLESENDGVVESALAHIASMKLQVPSASVSRVREHVGKLTTSGRTPATRYKAYLAKQVFDYPELFEQESHVQYTKADALFGALALRMNSALMGYNQQ